MTTKTKTRRMSSGAKTASTSRTVMAGHWLLAVEFSLKLAFEADSKANQEPLEPKQVDKTKSDEEFFQKFQQQQKKRENLEPKKRNSHRVFCPYFPVVSGLKPGPLLCAHIMAVCLP
jgi:hypothetical protein